jgi:hypothetical protein
MIKNRLWIGLSTILILLIPFVAVRAAHLTRSSAQPSDDPKCSSSSPCIVYQNNGAGAAIRGVAVAYNGVSGWTKTNSTSGGNGTAGVAGADKSSSGTFDSGVAGVSTRGIGVSGTSTSGYGMQALSFSADGMYGYSSTSNGLEGVTNNDSLSTKVGRSGVRGDDDTTDGGQLNHGVSGDSINGIGVEGNATKFVGVNAVGGFDNVSIPESWPALSVVGGASNPDFLLLACPAGTANPCNSDNSVFNLDNQGDILADNGTFRGEVYTSGSCMNGCVNQHQVKQGVRFYTPRESLPTVEDFGESQLVAGRAYVRMDPAFADTIDQQAKFLVFITPEGDADALFVSQKSVSGFSVTESRGGRDSIAFQYRIVAKPYGENAPRLQRFAIRSIRMERVN